MRHLALGRVHPWPNPCLNKSTVRYTKKEGGAIFTKSAFLARGCAALIASGGSAFGIPSHPSSFAVGSLRLGAGRLCVAVVEVYIKFTFRSQCQNIRIR